MPRTSKLMLVLVVLVMVGILGFAQEGPGMAGGLRAPEYSGGIEPNDLESSIFGVGYAALKPPGIAKTYGRAGLRAARLANVQWQFVEPVRPFRKHRYRWNLMDIIVKEYQAHGLVLQVILRAKSKWASRPLANRKLDIGGGGIATSFPKEDCLDDYAAWIGAVVERYDGDGQNDMPGLRFPIYHYEIESEAQHEAAWQGTAEEYIRLLKIANEAAKAACPRVKIILSGFDMGDLFDDSPSEKVLAERFAKIEQAGRRDQRFIETTLKATDAYDIIEFHYNRDYKGLSGLIAYIRRFSSKPIWAGDAASGPFLLAVSEVFFNPMYPPEKGAALAKRIGAGEKEAVAWFRKEQAKLTTQKITTAAGEGVKKVFMELTAVWKRTAGMGGFHNNFSMQNMVNDDMTPLPVFRTLELLVQKLDGFTSVARVNVGTPNVYAYKFTVKGRPVHVVWYDDGKNQGPGEGEGHATVKLPFGSGQASVTQIITGMTQTQATTSRLVAQGGALSLELDETPVIVESM